MTRFFMLTLMITPILFACQNTSFPIPKDRDTFRAGNITKGKKFGLSIGDKIDVPAMKYLGQKSKYVIPRTKCSGYTREVTGCSEDDEIVSFRINDIRGNGFIYVMEKDGNIDQIIWYLPLLSGYP